MKKYYHTKDVFTNGVLIDDFSYKVREKLLKYKGRDLLVIQKRSARNSPFVVVPGFVKSYKTDQTPEGIEISEIEEVPKELQSDITKFLRERDFEGPINFWRTYKSLEELIKR